MLKNIFLASSFLIIGLCFIMSANTLAQKALPKKSKQKSDTAKTMTYQEWKKNLQNDLNAVTIAFQKSKPKDMNERIIIAGNSTFRLLMIIGRAIDRSSLYASQIAEHRTKFDAQYKSAKEPAKKMVNGFVSMYSMYGTIATMYTRAGKNTVLVNEIDEIEEAVQQKMHAKISAMEITSTVGAAGYKLLALTLREADTSGVLKESLTSVQQNYTEGEKVAESDEDRFLNAVFRMFELSHLWAFAIDQTAKESLNKLYASVIEKSKAAEEIGEQIAVAVEHLYYATHAIAMGYVKR